MSRLEMGEIFLSTAAETAVEDLKSRLRHFSRLTKKKQEPEIWAQLDADGVLIIKVKVATSKGQVIAEVKISPEHWERKGGAN